jgi:hypothetical protein
MPPAAITAADSSGGHAPAIGASSTGTRRLKASQKAWARSRTGLVRRGVLMADLAWR